MFKRTSKCNNLRRHLLDDVTHILKDKELADSKETIGTLIPFRIENADAVKKFVEIAKENEGSYKWYWAIQKKKYFLLTSKI
ncbi:hypothetical protein [Enterococcus villorum]|uniref:hypothetical protein n=1 Tax=Enterococcus villorum TaxID=112904 RepID=UPI001F4E77D5|nr:hypothetical protein [Enterococcus villorum]